MSTGAGVLISSSASGWNGQSGLVPEIRTALVVLTGGT